MIPDLRYWILFSAIRVLNSSWDIVHLVLVLKHQTKEGAWWEWRFLWIFFGQSGLKVDSWEVIVCWFYVGHGWWKSRDRALREIVGALLVAGWVWWVAFGMFSCSGHKFNSLRIIVCTWAEGLLLIKRGSYNIVPGVLLFKRSYFIDPPYTYHTGLVCG